MNKLNNQLARFRHSKWFSNLTSGIIIFYACVLGFRTIDELQGDFVKLLFFLDSAITVYFVFEISIKLYVEKRKLDFFKDAWNVFDFIIVAVALLPLENSELVAVARLVRIFRILKLITASEKLKLTINTLLKSIPAIVDIVLLLFVIFYVYAILGNFWFKDMPSGLWEDFLVSMLTLFRVFTFEDWTDVMYETMEVYPYSWLYFVSFIIIAAFVFFNLFVAVIIDEMQNLKDEAHDNSAGSRDDKLDAILVQMRELKQELADLKRQNEADK